MKLIFLLITFLSTTSLAKGPTLQTMVPEDFKFITHTQLSVSEIEKKYKLNFINNSAHKTFKNGKLAIERKNNKIIKAEISYDVKGPAIYQEERFTKEYLSKVDPVNIQLQVSAGDPTFRHKSGNIEYEFYFSNSSKPPRLSKIIFSEGYYK